MARTPRRRIMEHPKPRSPDLGGLLSDLGSPADLGVCQNAAQQVGSVPETLLCNPPRRCGRGADHHVLASRLCCVSPHRLGLSTDFRRLASLRDETRESGPVFLVGEKGGELAPPPHAPNSNSRIRWWDCWRPRSAKSTLPKSPPTWGTCWRAPPSGPGTD